MESKNVTDEHIKIALYVNDATKIFPNTDIKGGVAIVYRDAKVIYGAIGEFIPDEHLRELLSHFPKNESNNFSSIMYGGRSDLKFNYEFLRRYPNSKEDRLLAIQADHPNVKELGPNEEYELKSSTLEILPYAFYDQEPENSNKYYRILGLVGTKRVYRWIEKQYLTPRYPNNNINGYKVFISKASGTGKFGETLSEPVIGLPGDSATPSFIGIGNFGTREQCIYASKYICTKFARALLGALKITQDIVPAKWAYVPMQDFTNNSDIDWTKSISEIDRQLYKKYHLSADEIEFIESNVKSMDPAVKTEYEADLLMKYDDLVSALLKKYGAAKHDYFTDRECTIKNKLVSRTAEGLFCHHIDEDKAIMLSNDEYAAKNPFEYQKKNRLVYCNLLEHLLLHVKIAEEPRNPDANENELPGIGGAINYICKQLNDIYAGKEPTDEWRKKATVLVKDNFDDYIRILCHLWSVIEQNPLYKAAITKQMLCTGWDGKVVERVLEEME